VLIRLSLGFLVVAGQLGIDLGLLETAAAAALVAAGLLSVLLFPVAALAILHRRPDSAGLPVPERA
jgi:predicted Kef-type K+ transport protein